MDRGWETGAPIDLFAREQIKAGRLKAYLALPFLTTPAVETSDSDIRGQLDLGREVMNVYRKAFFVDADLRAVRTELDALLPTNPDDDLTQIYLKTLGFVLSAQFQKF
jgi:hypothetical protein